MAAGDPARRSTGARWAAAATVAAATLATGVALAAPAGAGAPVASRHAAGQAPPYVTILFGRTQNGQVYPCRSPTPGGVSIPTVLAVLAQHNGGIGTGALVVSKTPATADTCGAGTQHPSWATLAGWRATYGFQVVSEGNYVDMTSISQAQQAQQSCGLLSTFSAHGFTRANGMFAYPGNKFTRAIQANVVSTCFDFGRTYRGAVNHQADLAPPYFAAALSVTGGSCNVAGQACYSVVSGRRYVLPSVLGRMFAVRPGDWSVVQLYRLVTGRNLTGYFRWDCTSSDPALHWTNAHEDYCWNDVQAALATMPAGAVITDPATVAAAWHRQPGARAGGPTG